MKSARLGRRALESATKLGFLLGFFLFVLLLFRHLRFRRHLTSALHLRALTTLARRRLRRRLNTFPPSLRSRRSSRRRRRRRGTLAPWFQPGRRLLGLRRCRAFPAAFQSRRLLSRCSRRLFPAALETRGRRCSRGRRLLLSALEAGGRLRRGCSRRLLATALDPGRGLDRPAALTFDGGRRRRVLRRRPHAPPL